MQRKKSYYMADDAGVCVTKKSYRIMDDVEIRVTKKILID